MMNDEMTHDGDEMMNMSMCGCGFLGVYHIGVATALVTRGRRLLEKIDRYAGASAGSLVSAITLLAPERLEDCKQYTYQAAAEVRRRAFGALTPGFHLLEPLRAFLEETLPPDADVRASGRLYISVTNVNPKMDNVVVNTYKSRQELIEKLIDGGYTNNLPVFSEGRTVCVSPFAGGQDICPLDLSGRGWYFSYNNQDFQWNKFNLARGIHALFPPSQDRLEKYFCRGKVDCIRFLKREGFLNP
ncbi:hypothetical protein ScPMuIL_018929 [Solemya velum]